MSNKISKPCKITASEKSIIAKNFTIHTDWEKPIFDSLKKKIRENLRPKQRNKCCYCKKDLGYDIKEVDIEHIIPKAEFKNFTFEPFNLALSCPACNTKKGDTKILSKSVIRYPKTTKSFLIVHAHFDKYNEHIIIHDDCIFEGVSKKGCRTIEVCELFRLKAVEEKAKKVLTNRTKQSELIDLVMKASPTELNNVMIEIGKRIK
jgi:uncharacterized protein (TIGR02646 family)